MFDGLLWWFFPDAAAGCEANMAPTTGADPEMSSGSTLENSVEVEESLAEVDHIFSILGRRIHEPQRAQL